MPLLVVLVGVLGLGLGLFFGWALTLRRIPHTIAAMDLAQIEALGERVQQLRPPEKETTS